MDMMEMDEPGVAMGALDPAANDPRYWERFQERVMAGQPPRGSAAAGPGVRW